MCAVCCVLCAVCCVVCAVCCVVCAVWCVLCGVCCVVCGVCCVVCAVWSMFHVKHTQITGTKKPRSTKNEAIILCAVCCVVTPYQSDRHTHIHYTVGRGLCHPYTLSQSNY